MSSWIKEKDEIKITHSFSHKGAYACARLNTLIQYFLSLISRKVDYKIILDRRAISYANNIHEKITQKHGCMKLSRNESFTRSFERYKNLYNNFKLLEIKNLYQTSFV
jgi:hypothetical protein